ncbi:MAG: replicative DNA helicase [Planctomycetia bacterium]|nr:replicative DNA helicase [Planctomycetia bacterium]
MATAQRVDKPLKVSPEILDRALPHSADAEKGVLGSLLLLPDVADEVALILRPEDFYDEAHRHIYREVLAIHEQGKRVDLTLLCDKLKVAGVFETVGGYGYVAELAASVPTAANAEHYARIVQEKATLRSIIVTSTEVLRDAYNAKRQARDLLNHAEERMFAIHDERWSGEVRSMEEVLHETFAQIDARAKGGIAGVPSGFKGLDALTGGLHASELVVLAGRPSMGKTALATNIAAHVAVEWNTCTLFVSLEMSRLELAQRMLCSRAEVSSMKFRSNFLNGDDMNQLMAASGEMSRAPLYIDDTPSRTITEIAATARRLKRKHNLGLVVIDYLQLIEPDNSDDPRQEQVAKMCRRLKTLARETKVPVLCLAQLNRQAELSKDNRPRLAHLRESGAIEQDADVVLLVHREEYYLSPEQRESENFSHLKGKALAIVAKQRNGAVGDVPMLWFQEFTRFKDAADQPAFNDFQEFS